MMLRKINAVLSLVATVLLLGHALFHGVWMLTGGEVALPIKDLPHVLFVAMMLHAVISIVLAFLGHKGAEKRRCNGYPNMNKVTNIQRMGGMLLIVLTILHIAVIKGALNAPYIVHAVFHPLFFAITLIHIAVSGSKAFITLGIGSAGFIKIADVVIKVICGITLIADVTGFYLYLG